MKMNCPVPSLLLVLALAFLPMSFSIAPQTLIAQQNEEDSDESESEISKAWKDLAGGDPEATRAALYFASRPDETIEFFTEHLESLRIDDDTFESLASDLFGDDLEKAEAAHDRFSYLDPRLYMDLPALMDKYDDDEKPLQMQRLVTVLSGFDFGYLDDKNVTFRQTQAGNEDEPAQYNFSSDGMSWWAEADISKLNSRGWTSKKTWNRATRAVVILEHIGAPKATPLLSRMAQGHQDARPTIVAKKIAMEIKMQEKKEKK